MLHFTGTNKRLFREFCSDYQSFMSPEIKRSNHPFVYVTQNEIKLITNVADCGVEGEIFAIGVAENGIIEVLTNGHSDCKN